MAARGIDKIFRLAGREPSVEDDVNVEIETHLAETTEWLVSQGRSVEAAREEARRRFGDIGTFRRELGTIDRRAGLWRRAGEGLDGIRQDLHLAWRGLRRSPGYAAVVIGTLGLALGANATMFGVVDRLLLQPPSGFAAPEMVGRIDPARWMEDHFEAWSSLSYPSFEALRETASFSHVAAVTEQTLSYGLGLEARPVRATFASGQYFDLVGVSPALGRLFREAEDAPPSGAPVAVLSHGFWREAFGADPAAVGRSILLNGKPHEIIGVAPAGFNGSDLSAVDLWLPLADLAPTAWNDSQDWRTAKGMQWLTALARRRPEVSMARALAEATEHYRRANADFAPFEAKAEVRARPLAAYSEGAGPERIAGWLYGVTVIVLLIACANIANVVLARGVVKRSESAVRQALGIPRGRLVRQLLAETALVTGFGVALGLAIAKWGGLVVRRFLVTGTSFATDTVNMRVLLATAGAGVLAALLASLWPLLRSTRVDPALELHGAGRGTSRSGGRARGALLLAQTTLSTALVVMAGLFLRSIRTIETMDLGFEPANATLVSVNLSNLNGTAAEALALFERAADRIRAIPGVTAAGMTQSAPLLNNRGGRIRVPGRDSIPRLKGGGPYFFAITPGTLAAYGVRLLEGRDFSDADRAGSAPVIIVSQAMARVIWPGESPIGKCVIRGADSMPCSEVIGVSADVHRQELEEAPFMLYFSSLSQEAESSRPDYLVVRSRPGTRGLEAGIKAAFLAERSDLPFIRIRPYQEILDGQSRQWRLGATLLTVFGGLSLVIAAIGLYGVVAFGISQRTREIGLRSALGASPGRLIRAVMAGGLSTAAAGVGLGLVVAVLAAPRIQGLLFQTSARDATVLVTAAGLVLLVSAAAAWIPGRRAVRIDPVTALRAE